MPWSTWQVPRMMFDCHTPRCSIVDQTMPLALAELTNKISRGYSCTISGHMAVDLQVVAKWMVHHTRRHYCSLNILVLQHHDLLWTTSKPRGSRKDDLDQISSGSIHNCPPRHKNIPKHVTSESTSAKVRLTKHRSISPATSPRHNVFGEETSVLMTGSVTATSQPST